MSLGKRRKPSAVLEGGDLEVPYKGRRGEVVRGGLDLGGCSVSRIWSDEAEWLVQSKAKGKNLLYDISAFSASVGPPVLHSQ